MDDVAIGLLDFILSYERILCLLVVLCVSSFIRRR